MKPDQFKILWATAPERLEADRAALAALGEKDVQPFSVVGNAPADLQGQDTAVVLLPPSSLALNLEDAGKALRVALLAAGVPVFEALRSDLAENGAAWERKKAHLVSFAIDAVRQTAASKERSDLLARLALGDVLEEFQTAETDPPLYATGLADLDRVLNGGLREGVYVVQGVPGGGKTALALYIAGSILKGNPEARVLYHSLEMSRRQVAARVLARLAYDLAGSMTAKGAEAENMGRYFFADKYAPRELDWQTPSRLHDLAPEKDGFGARIQAGAGEEFQTLLPRFMVAYRGAFPDGRGQPSVDRLAAIGKDVAKDGPPPVVFVDYLQLIPPPEDYRGERRDVVGYNSSMLEQMAHDLRTPVVVLSSMNRTAVKEAQTTGTIQQGAAKESGDIDYNADAVLGLVDVLTGEGQDKKPLTFAEEEGHRAGKVVEVQVAKNRTGPSTFRGIHPRLDWLNAWGVYEASRHPAGDEDGVGENAARAISAAWAKRR